MPAHLVVLRMLDTKLGLLSYPAKLGLGSIARPQYGHCLLHAAKLAAKLGRKRISAIEFGVAGGNGLVALEMHAEQVTRTTGVEVDIYGFDTGQGMPPPADWRDLPYLFQEGSFRMDVDKLKARLRKAKLILGPVESTVDSFFERENPAPVGFVVFDLDYYSATTVALKILEGPHGNLLPRVACYVDDMVGDLDWAYSEFTGELLAIREFNEKHNHIKVAPVQGMRFFADRVPMQWHEQIFCAHLFTHPDYGRPVADFTQLPLEQAR